jgi:hypothetical protein
MSDLSPFREEDTDVKRLNGWQQKSRVTSDALYTNPLRWMRLAIYCKLSGDTSDAVHARRRKRQWIDGVQCGIGPDGNLWINPVEVNKWVASQMPRAARENSPAHAA